MISDDRAEQALRYLVTTDENCGYAKSEMEQAEGKAKAMEATVFLHSEGSNDVRKALAKVDAKVAAAWADYYKCVSVYSAMANKRETERIVLDTWRTISANRRAGA